MRAALSEKGRIGAVDTVASLATVHQLLLADEALVLHASIFGRIGKICIRADSVQSSMQVMDSTARTDARLLMAALTAAHPASNEADSQFPAAQAVRLGKLLFGGLEDCLRRSPRIFVVSSPDTVEQVPPGHSLPRSLPRWAMHTTCARRAGWSATMPSSGMIRAITEAFPSSYSSAMVLD